jgi:hypothetical protein
MLNFKFVTWKKIFVSGSKTDKKRQYGLNSCGFVDYIALIERTHWKSGEFPFVTKTKDRGASSNDITNNITTSKLNQ